MRPPLPPRERVAVAVVWVIGTLIAYRWVLTTDSDAPHAVDLLVSAVAWPILLAYLLLDLLARGIAAVLL